MAYTTDLLKHLIMVQNRKAAKIGKHGVDSCGIEWEDTVCLWASVEFVRGKSAMREGALDVYGVVMVRMRWTDQINERSRIVYEGRKYAILGETFHADRQDNIIQFNAQAIIDNK